MILVGLLILGIVAAIFALQLVVVVGVIVCWSIGEIWRAIR